jgi:hypothetical protein
MRKKKEMDSGEFKRKVNSDLKKSMAGRGWEERVSHKIQEIVNSEQH